MKKLLAFALALSIAASISLSAQAVKKSKTKSATKPKPKKPDTVLFYGCTTGSIEDLYFIQKDTSLAPSYFKCSWGEHYCGEAISGGTYKCTLSIIKLNDTVYVGQYGLAIPADFDFVLPKGKNKIVYLGYKNCKGQPIDISYLDNNGWYKKDTPEEKEKTIKKWELKARKKAVNSMLIEFTGTKWEPLLKKELEKIEDLQKQLKNSN